MNVHNGVDKLSILCQSFPANGISGIGEPAAQFGPLGLALQDQPVPGVTEPGSSGQNGNHGVGSHSGADQTVKIPGNCRYAVGQAEGDGGTDTVFFCVLPGAVQGTGIDVRRDYAPGNSTLQQVNAKIAVVTAHIRHPVAGRYKGAAGQQPVGKGRNH